MGEVQVEYFPRYVQDEKTGTLETNPQLMSFAQLYVDEIVRTISDSFNDAVIKEFLRAIDAPNVELKNDHSDLEWLVYSLLRHTSGFNKLFDYISAMNTSLLEKMTLRNESGIYKETVEAFKKYFLKPARNLAKDRMAAVLQERQADFDYDEENEFDVDDSDEEKENRKSEEKKNSTFDSEYDNDTTLDSDDTLPDDHPKKMRLRTQPMPAEEEELADEREEEEPPLYGYKETVLDKIASIFDPEFAKSTLENAYSVLNVVKDPLNTPTNAYAMKYSPWARAILRELPRMAPERNELDGFPEIIFKFARACENDPTNRVALLYLFPDYQAELIKKAAASTARHSTGAAKLATVKDVVKECRSADEYASQRRAPTHDYQTTAMPISLRDYQKELVEKANSGENTVIVAPTGSGKTVVAAQIMRHHVTQRKAQKKPFRMVMVVPKIPLVEQQQKQLYQYMNDVVHSAILHGDMMFEEQGKIEKVLCAELIVMTPQILINLLESVRSEKRLFVADITLLILDECHHCVSNHPYAQLMTTIRDWEYDKPQIVGLTASLGVGKDGTLHEASAYEHVVQLLARLTATSISTVVIHDKELEAHVRLPIDDIRDVRRSSSDTSIPFTDKLRDYMNLVTSKIRKPLDAMARPGNDSGALIPQTLLKTKIDYNETEKYGGRIEAIKSFIRTMSDGVVKADLNMALDVLKVCNMAWGMNDLLPSSTVWPMLKVEMFKLSSRNAESRYIKEFYKSYHDALEKVSDLEDSNDMLAALKSELTGQFKKNRNSKVIIFVATRELSSALCDYINSRETTIGMGEGREAGFIISSKARGVGTISQTPDEQKQALRKFRENKLAVLVSTTVAEEGLDVPECNLIIKYNMTGNVISLTQQRGRARAKDSRSVLIVLSGSVKKRELENANAERMMNHIVRKIHQQGDEMLRRAVEKTRNEMLMQERAEKENARRKKESLQSKNYEILCDNCNTVLCDSIEMKYDASHYFACYKRIWELVDIETDIKGKYIDMVTTVLGKIKCKGGIKGDGCGHELGKVINYYGCYLPSIKCASIALMDKSDKALVKGSEFGVGKKKSWSEVSDNLFFISKISHSDVDEMIHALRENNLELFEFLELTCREISKKTRRDAQRKYEQKKEEDELVGADSD